MNSPVETTPVPVSRPRPPASAGVALSSSELFRDGQEVVIRHDGQCYRLRITRQNKLILTK